jgi:hypothetical protein
MALCAIFNAYIRKLLVMLDLQKISDETIKVEVSDDKKGYYSQSSGRNKS